MLVSGRHLAPPTLNIPRHDGHDSRGVDHDGEHGDVDNCYYYQDGINQKLNITVRLDAKLKKKPLLWSTM